MVIIWVKPRQKRRTVYCAKEGFILERVGNPWDVLSFTFHEPAKMMPDAMATVRKLKIETVTNKNIAVLQPRIN